MTVQKRKRLGELLLERGLLSTEQLDEALNYQKRTERRFGEAVVDLGYLTETQLARAIADHLKVRLIDPRAFRVDPAAVEKVPAGTAEKNLLMPLAIREVGGRKILHVAMADPLNLDAIDDLSFATGMQINSFLATLSHVREAIRINYYGKKYNLVQPPAVRQVALPAVSGNEPADPGAQASQRSFPGVSVPAGPQPTARPNTYQMPAMRDFKSAGTYPGSEAPPAPGVDRPQARGTPTRTDGTFSGPRPAALAEPRRMPSGGTFVGPRPAALGGSTLPPAPPSTPGNISTTAQTSPGPQAAPAATGQGDARVTARLQDPTVQLNALLRVMIRKKLITKEEYLAELQWLAERVAQTDGK